MLLADQLSVLELYLPPVSEGSQLKGARQVKPPQMIISLPVHTVVCLPRGSGAFAVLVATQLFVLGLYLPPVSRKLATTPPPQTIISLPVQTAV
jgi:hypothetical protein